MANQNDSGLTEKVIQINRVSKKTKGGNNISFSVLAVVGDRKGKIGVGLGKAPDVISAIKKAVKRGRQTMIVAPIEGTTIPFPIRLKLGAAKILLKPAPKGTGIVAGGAIRAVADAVGIRDIVGKILGSNNVTSNVYATFAAMKRLTELAKQKKITQIT
jgi:small subunit ribosomal protein S5